MLFTERSSISLHKSITVLIVQLCSRCAWIRNARCLCSIGSLVTNLIMVPFPFPFLIPILILILIILFFSRSFHSNKKGSIVNQVYSSGETPCRHDSCSKQFLLDEVNTFFDVSMQTTHILSTCDMIGLFCVFYSPSPSYSSLFVLSSKQHRPICELVLFTLQLDSSDLCASDAIASEETTNFPFLDQT